MRIGSAKAVEQKAYNTEGRSGILQTVITSFLRFDICVLEELLEV